MTIFSHFQDFIKRFCSASSPLLLALSGGPDSLCLFYCLLMSRQREGIPFHVAHVDHGWRPESQDEANALKQLTVDHQVPFHLKTLDPQSLKGNLEAACREERYTFFAELSRQNNFQGVMTGHHQDDQAETVYKRIVEGAHWSRWVGLKPESWHSGVRLLRPFLTISKSEIQQFLSQRRIEAFEDPTNHHVQFLRARLRKTIFPWLNREFGKQVQKNLVHIGKEAEELNDYFERHLAHLMEDVKRGPEGVSLNLQNKLPASLIEIKYLIRLLCAREQFFLSREIIEQVAVALQVGKRHQLFMMGSRQIRVDRQCLFMGVV